MLRAGDEECSTVAWELLTELKWARAVIPEQLFQLCATLYHGTLSQIGSLVMEKIKAIKKKPLRLPPDGWFECLEIRSAAVILDDYLTIEDCGPTVQSSCWPDKARVAVAPVEAVAGIGSHLAMFNDEKCAVAVVLEFVNPLPALGGGLPK
jgi:hypothetical protein